MNTSLYLDAIIQRISAQKIRTELHSFLDVSQDAIGASVYLKLRKEYEEVAVKQDWPDIPRQYISFGIMWSSVAGGSSK